MGPSSGGRETAQRGQRCHSKQGAEARPTCNSEWTTTQRQKRCSWLPYEQVLGLLHPNRSFFCGYFPIYLGLIIISQPEGPR